MDSNVYLSYPLNINTPMLGGLPSPKIDILQAIDTHGSSVYDLSLINHSGTHADAPAHVIKNGLSINDFTPEDLAYTKPVSTDIRLGDTELVTPELLETISYWLKDADLVLFRFGYGSVRSENPERYCEKAPGFSVAAGTWLRENCPNLRAIGMDIPSITCSACREESRDSHTELLIGDGRKFLIIEDMKLNVDLTGLREVRVNPWLIEGIDSAPCTVIGCY